MFEIFNSIRSLDDSRGCLASDRMMKTKTKMAAKVLLDQVVDSANFLPYYYSFLFRLLDFPSVFVVGIFLTKNKKWLSRDVACDKWASAGPQGKSSSSIRVRFCIEQHFHVLLLFVFRLISSSHKSSTAGFPASTNLSNPHFLGFRKSGWKRPGRIAVLKTKE